MQSAYRKFHSTETALLRVHNDISVSLDKGHVTALTLLDVSISSITTRIELCGMVSLEWLWLGLNPTFVAGIKN